VQHGRVCSHHDTALSGQTEAPPPVGYRQQTLSALNAVRLAKPVRHWSDPDDDREAQP